MKRVVSPLTLVVLLLLGTLQAPVAASRHLLGTSPSPGQKQRNEAAAKQQTQTTTARTAPAGANPNSATTGHGARSDILQVTPSSRVELGGSASGHRNLLQNTATPPVKAPASQPVAPGQKQPNEAAAKQQPQAANKGRTAPAGQKPTSSTTGQGARIQGILQVSSASRLELAGASGQRNLLQNTATPPVKAPASQPVAPAPGQKQPVAAKQQPQAAKGRTAPAGSTPAGSTATGQAARNSDVAGNKMQITNDPDGPLDLSGTQNGGRAPGLFGRHRSLLATSPPVKAPASQTVAPGQKQPNEAAAKQQPQAANKGRTAPAGQKPAGTTATGQAARNVIALTEPISISQAKP